MALRLALGDRRRVLRVAIRHAEHVEAVVAAELRAQRLVQVLAAQQRHHARGRRAEDLRVVHAGPIDGRQRQLRLRRQVRLRVQSPGECEARPWLWCVQTPGSAFKASN